MHQFSSLFVASLSTVIRQLLFVSFPVVLIHIDMFLFDYLQFYFCLFVYSVLSSVLILEFYSTYFNPTLHQPSGKSINIIHKTVPSIVFVQEARTYYNYNTRGYGKLNLFNSLKTLAIQANERRWQVTNPHTVNR